MPIKTTEPARAGSPTADRAAALLGNAGPIPAPAPGPAYAAGPGHAAGPALYSTAPADGPGGQHFAVAATCCGPFPEGSVVPVDAWPPGTEFDRLVASGAIRAASYEDMGRLAANGNPEPLRPATMIVPTSNPEAMQRAIQQFGAMLGIGPAPLG